MKHDDLWNDSLDDAMSPGVAAESLATLQRASRRARRRRRAARVLALGLVCAAAALALWPRPHAPLPPAVAVESQPVPVRYLTDDEFIARLNEAGYGVVITHHDGANQVQLIPQDDGFVPIPY